MQAEIIAIGDELTSGQRVDTNSAWLSQRLGELGIRVAYHTTAADDLTACSTVFLTALARAELVLCTGGLGPTADDLTRQALADAVQKSLVLDEDALAHIITLFQRYGREMPERNRVQAMFPEGSRVIPNPHGTAPGVDFTQSFEGGRTSRVMALPGVPAEMKEMWEQTVRSEIASMVGVQRVIRHRSLKCFGIGESDLEQRLPDLIRRGREPTVGITVHRATITLRITSDGVSEAHCHRAMQPTIDTIHECLGELVFGEESDELQDAIAAQLVAGSKTLATGEIGTRGLIARWMGATSLATDCFRGGAVTLDEARLVEVVGAELLAGATVAQRHEALADAIRRGYGADYGLVVGAFPDEANEDAHYYIGLATADERSSHRARYTGHPDILEERSAKQALNYLRLRLLNG